MQAGGELQRQVEAHKERLHRLGKFARPIPPVFREREFISIVAVPFKLGPIENYWREMWCGDLVFGTPRFETVTIPQIISSVAEHFSIRPDLILSPTRSYLITLPRQIAIYFARRHTIESTTELGRQFDRDHSTVLHACRKIERMIRQSDPIVYDINTISRALGRW